MPDPAEARRLKTTRVVGLCVLAFLNMLVYAMVRPATESLFIERHTREGLPLVWLLLAVGVFAVVVLYNRFIARTNLLRLFGAIAALSALALVTLLVARRVGLPAVDYLLYTFKDIYMVVLVEVFYSYTNSTFPIRTARWIYGLFGLLAALGGMVGSALLGLLAHHLGTTAALWFATPLLLLLAALCWPFARLAGGASPSGPSDPADGTDARRDAQRDSLLGAARVVRGSSYLLMMLLLVALVQAVVTLVDYEYYSVMERAYPEQDSRTVMIGVAYGATSVSTIALNAVTGPVLRLAGVPLTLLAIPFLLGAGILIFRAAPSVLTASIVKVASKAFDYTLFRSAKELLYIPLSYEEKTKGKSIVDIITYRMAKGAAAAVVLLLQELLLAVLVTPSALTLVLGWIAVTVIIARRFRRVVSRERELLARE